ncbi:hypothetical protein ACU5AX_14830 [Sphingomonas sp. XXL09]|uniref:hypothetical protein n=1 Tax=Sphingomonas sp. XXL09 TaxID=3457787 RepID=UPI00406BDAEF
MTRALWRLTEQSHLRHLPDARRGAARRGAARICTHVPDAERFRRWARSVASVSVTSAGKKSRRVAIEVDARRASGFISSRVADAP